MREVEDDASIRIAWCNYLWQRAYTFIAWPGQWYLVVGLAHQLLEHRTLDGAAAERYLRIAAAKVQYDPWMPNAGFIAEVTFVCSPWHREWHTRSWDTPMVAKRTALPQTLEGLSAQVDVRPISEALATLSARVGWAPAGGPETSTG